VSIGRLLIVLPVLVFLGLAALLAKGLYSGDPREVPSVFIGKPAPEFALAGLEGRRQDADLATGLSDEDLAGGSVSLVNVWASWCAPCRVEHPHLMALAQEEGLLIHGINYKDTPPKAVGFLDELGDPYTRVGADADGRAAIEWGVYGVPETFVVDGTGRILAKHVGAIDEDAIRKTLRPAIEAGRKAALP
jgi:cytochrome c biogenesis protein CcmG/thiol:disulfide interchange protein DsbE